MKRTKLQSRALHLLELGPSIEAKGHELDSLRAFIQCGYAFATPCTVVEGEERRYVYITDAGRAALERSEG